jgi:hypothetical protein
MTGADGFVGLVSFRLRLLRLALQPLDRIPASVVMALEDPIYDAELLLREGETAKPMVR